MSNFINKKNKLESIVYKNNSNYPTIIRQDNNDKQQKELLNIQLKSPEQCYKNIYVASTEFEEMSFCKSLTGYVQTPYRLFKNWKIEFSKFDYRLLGHIKIEPIIQPISSIVDDSTDELIIYRSHFFTIYDLENEDYFKRVILTVSLSVTSLSLTIVPYQREAKLLIQYINPIKVI